MFTDLSVIIPTHSTRTVSRVFLETSIIRAFDTSGGDHSHATRFGPSVVLYLPN